MSPSALSFAHLLVVLSASLTASAQVTGTFPPVPLASEHFDYNNLPYQADSNTGLIRGVQLGYNRCNSTTENQSSLCQTAIFNDISDFCLWAPPKPNSTVGDSEGEMVAWCTKPGHGTRLIPHDALQGVQFMRTPDYIQVVGFIDQTKINMADGDYGGELDPHGADFRGNPLGGLFYSTGFGSDHNKYTQVIEWHNFMGGNAFCLKACDPAGPNAAKFCQHIYDRIGCAYNAPNNAQKGVFESCLGDNQDFPGVYTSNGAVVTYTQPPESLGPISSIPYTARIPASSSCTTFASSSLYAAIATVNAPGQTASATTTSAHTVPTSKPGGSATSGGPKPTASGSNDATTVAVGGVATLLGVVFSALFLA